ncbi:hypothetical protein T484DRAFT_1832472 [Baffinella frigidus]|nr:hypothetical protein T484DRAFT_1832472 [Cryptophyta sp. CCMP2293]
MHITLFAYVLMIFERPTDDGTLRHYANCVWLIIITMTTVGPTDDGTLRHYANCVWLIIITMTTVGCEPRSPTLSYG